MHPRWVDHDREYRLAVWSEDLTPEGLERLTGPEAALMLSRVHHALRSVTSIRAFVMDADPFLADLDEAAIATRLAWLVECERIVLWRRMRSEVPAGLLSALESEEAEPGEGTSTTTENHWIQVQVVDDDGNPVPSVPYELELPDSRVVRGRTNQYGVIYMSGLDAGQCKLKLPEHDAAAWEQA